MHFLVRIVATVSENQTPRSNILRTLMICIAAVSLALIFGVQVKAQSAESQHSGSAATEKRKSELDRVIEEAASHGEPIFGVCLEKCEESKITVPGDFEAGKPIEMPKPAYPALASKARASGEVQVQVIVNEEGKVIAAESIAGHPLLQAAAVTAARSARFSPYRLNGKPVKVMGVISFNFVL
jgi:TonB family protein